MQLAFLNSYPYYFISLKVRFLGWVSGGEFFQDIHPGYYLTEDSVLAIKVVPRFIGNEKLAAISIRSRIGHRQSASNMSVLCKFVGEGVTGITPSCSRRVSPPEP
ncbi:hypothetical protein ES703_55392 [subsurface metagenome]